MATPHDELSEDEKERAIRLAADIEDYIEDILMSSLTGGIRLLFDPMTYLSYDRILEVALYALRDFKRISVDQEKGVSVTKLAGYIGFWFAKIKPISSIHIGGGDGEDIKTEFTEVNEEAAIILMDQLLWDAALNAKELVPTTWKNCPCDCSLQLNGATVKGKCYREANIAFLKAEEGRFRNYIVYGLRFRSVSPYFLVNYLEQGIHFACHGNKHV